MKSLKLLLVIFLLALMPWTIYGQSQDINFTLESTSITINGDVVPLNSSLTKNNNILNWIQHTGSQQTVSTFNITSIQGSWNPETSSGELIYQLEQNGFQNTLRILGGSSGIAVSLSSTESTGSEIYQFTITSITYN